LAISSSAAASSSKTTHDCRALPFGSWHLGALLYSSGSYGKLGHQTSLGSGATSTTRCEVYTKGSTTLDVWVLVTCFPTRALLLRDWDRGTETAEAVSTTETVESLPGIGEAAYAYVDHYSLSQQMLDFRAGLNEVEMSGSKGHGFKQVLTGKGQALDMQTMMKLARLVAAKARTTPC
jgi:hypothetical protein